MSVKSHVGNGMGILHCMEIALYSRVGCSGSTRLGISALKGKSSVRLFHGTGRGDNRGYASGARLERGKRR